MAQANSALLQLVGGLSPYYTLYIDDSQRFGTQTYQTAEDAQAVCDALQDVYDRLCYGCVFSVRLRDAEVALPAFDARLINVDER